MDSIVLHVSELKAMVDSLSEAGMKYAIVSLNEGEAFDGDVIPPAALISAVHPDHLDEQVDFDEIVAVPADEYDPQVEHTFRSNNL